QDAHTGVAETARGLKNAIGPAGRPGHHEINRSKRRRRGYPFHGTKQPIDVERKAGGGQITAEPSDEMVVAAAPAQLAADAIGEDVEDDAVVVIESAEFAQIQHESILH